MSISRTLALFLFFVLGSASSNARGLLWNDQDLAAWSDRAVNGPYRVSGDAFDSIVPGEWTRMSQSAASFRAAPSAERKYDYTISYDSSGATAPLFVKNHMEMLDAAFVALVEGDTALADLVKTELLWHARRSALQIDPSTIQKTDYGNWWNSAWLLRLVMAADFVKERFTAGELAEFQGWIRDWARSYENSVHQELTATLFRNRAQRDYVNEVGYTAEIPSYNTYAYKDRTGTKHNQIASVHRHYNNRRSSVMHFVGLAGIWLGDATLTDRGKLYFEEWLQFSVFPDGSTGEFERNTEKRNINQGILYNAINLEAAVSIADALARRGDTSLYDFSTRNGLFGTESDAGEAEKNLKMVTENHLDLIEKRKDWYYVGGTIEEKYRIDSDAEVGSNIGYQWNGEIYFAPLGNRFWKDDRIRAGYTRRTAKSIPYTKPLGSAGPFGPPWRGHQAVFPSMLFMFGEMEAVRGSYPTIDDAGTDGGTTGGTDGGTTGGTDGGTTDGTGEATVEPAAELVFARQYNYPNYEPLDGFLLNEPVYVAVKPDDQVVSVRFFNRVDGVDTLVNNENYRPYDYIAENRTFTAKDVPWGTMTVVAELTMLDGSVHAVTANVTTEEASVVVEPEPVSETSVLPDEWKMTYFGSVDAANSGPDEDYDGDGMTNHNEWLAGTDPSNPNDLLTLEPALGVAWSSKQGISYAIEVSNDNWKTTEQVALVTGNGERMVWIDPQSANAIDNRQYRIELIIN